MIHHCYNVLDLGRSLKFYADALGFYEKRRLDTSDFILVFLGDGEGDFELELTWLKNRTEPYDLGEGEMHLAVSAPDMAAAHKKHEEMGIICFENHDLGVYFIEDPDGYWIEVVPADM